MNESSSSTNQHFIRKLEGIVGKKHVLTQEHKTERYRKGFRSGQGKALAVVFPGSLLEQWRIFKTCVEADKIIIMQAANTGLTEGSTPVVMTMIVILLSSVPCVKIKYKFFLNITKLLPFLAVHYGT